MISIIICSAKADLLTAVSKNIAATIAVPFEIISFRNEEGRIGICELYNKGIEQAQFPLLCFMHEDIIIHTNNWGEIVADIFSNNPNLGLLGVAGSFYKPLAPSGWVGSSWMGQDIDTVCTNFIQAYKYVDKTPHLIYENPYNTSLAEVACVDGLWFCIPKHIAVAYKFDEQKFKGFHCYDVDFSIAVGLDHKVAVTYDVLLTHLSEGRFDKTWLTETFKLHKKWDEYLPINKGNFPRKKSLYLERVTFKHFLYQLTEVGLPLSTAYKILWQNSFLKKLGLKLFLKLNFYTYKKIKKAR